MTTTTTPFDVTGPLPLAESILLEASAGTGKTSAIAGLVVRYIAEGHAQLPQLMIATFSGASTRELRGRIRDQLESTLSAIHQAIAGAPSAADAVSEYLSDAPPDELARRRERVLAAYDGFDMATICTTHQFCDRMLTELGVFVDHEPRTTLVDDISSLVGQCVADEYLSRYAHADLVPFTIQTARLLGSYAADRSPTLRLAPWDAEPGIAERVSFAAAVRSKVEARKRQLGIYTFDDMQVRLRAALAPGHEAAREILRRRYPFVLIDEFQDTDPVQWDIVGRAFVGSSTVVLIGDPKQSIYGFRGADVTAYLGAAKNHGIRTRVLGTNYRSDPPLVKAVSTMLAGAALGLDEIRVTPVATSASAPSLAAPRPWSAPARIRVASPGTTTAAVDLDLVDDVSALLGSEARIVDRRRGGERPVTARDIAVIVSSNRRGDAIREALARRGVPVVFNGSSSVLTSPAADDWRTLLSAFERTGTRQTRAVTLTDFVGWSPAQLTTADDTALGTVAQKIRVWQRYAAEKGFVALYDLLVATDGLAERVLAHSGGDRVLTDLRHVADLLQAEQSRSGSGLAGLRAWLADETDDRGSTRDERSRRLETDALAVRVMTVHQSKGLQFPIVYLPDLSSALSLFDWQDRPYHVHLPDETGHQVRSLDVGGKAAQGASERRAMHEHEQAGEELRKLYVALTRAECHLVAWWVPSVSVTRSPLHRVLFRDPNGASVPDEVPLTDATPAEIPRLGRVGILVERLDPRPSRTVHPEPPSLIGAVAFTRAIDHAWRRTSYSALSAHTHETAPVEASINDEPTDRDDAVPPESEDDPPPGGASTIHLGGLGAPSPMADLPGGVAFGSLVHAVFEHVDHRDPAALEAIVTAETARLPVPGVAVDDLVAALVPALETPLGPLLDDRRLCDIEPSDRLPELDFELPLGTTGTSSLVEVASLLSRHLASDDPLADYPERLRSAGMTTEPLRGFLTGSIDAAIRVGDRVVVVDYKTNRLAPHGEPLVLGHYTASMMAEAMMASHYPLQALLYSVAMHRFLRWRWPTYDPERQLGGIAYLFVRGMAGADTPVVDGMRTGVFAWHPPSRLVTELSDLLAGGAT
jgi:exodeoxyribonuclease V beta subunit